MFGVIYKNTQIHLLKDILMSFGLSLLFPFEIYLIPGIFRIPALSNVNKEKNTYIILANFYNYYNNIVEFLIYLFK